MTSETTKGRAASNLLRLTTATVVASFLASRSEVKSPPSPADAEATSK
jgi:hypothetical protein